MKDILTYNLQLLGSAAKRGGCERAYYYPGMKGDQLANAITSGSKPSLNERNAFEFGYGACLAGKRTAVIFKGVGMATCLDSIHHAVIAGVHAGLVLVILEDTVAASSPEIVDSRTMLDYTGAVMIEPTDMASAQIHIAGAFSVSEQLDMPVILRLTHQLLMLADTEPEQLDVSKKFDAALPEYRTTFIGPWQERYKRYEQKLRDAQAYINSQYVNPLQGPTAICFGAAQFEGDDVTRIEHYPIPATIQKEFNPQRTAVLEVGSNYAKQKLITTPIRIDNSKMSTDAFKPSDSWQRALASLTSNTYSAVVGDEGRYTFDATGVIDICLCMGSSISIAAGMSEALGRPQLAVIGDFAFQFNAYQSIVEAHHRGISLDILLLDDKVAASTSEQVAVGPVRTKDIEAYLNLFERHDYSDLGGPYIKPNNGGINLYHVEKCA